VSDVQCEPFKMQFLLQNSVQYFTIAAIARSVSDSGFLVDYRLDFVKFFRPNAKSVEHDTRKREIERHTDI